MDARKAGLLPHVSIQGVILPSKEDMTAMITDNTANPSPNTYITFSDGSHNPEKGAGAATSWYSPTTIVSPPPNLEVLNVQVGDTQETTPYQAELVGFELAVANARAKAQPLTSFFWFHTDNQTLIRDLTEPLRPKTGLNTCIRIRSGLNKLLHLHPTAKVSILWCPSKADIPGMTAADKAAKAANSIPQLISTVPKPSTVRAQIKAQLKEAATMLPSADALTRLMKTFNPAKNFAALCKLPQPDTTFIARVRSGHCPLNSILFRFRASNTPNCNVCSQVEDIDHLLTVCIKFAGLQRKLLNKARLKNTPPNQTGLLTSPGTSQAVATFGRNTFRFYRVKFKRHIPKTQ